MFIKKDLRKIPKIMEDAALCDPAAYDDDNDDNAATVSKDGRPSKRSKVEAPLSELRLSRRQSEFQGSIHILCQPQYLPKLQMLQNLNLYDCAISNLNDMGLLAQSCPRLEILNLGRNPITTLPDELAALSPSLKELWLDDCQLTGPLPDCVSQLEHLESFRAPNNRITHIPESMVSAAVQNDSNNNSSSNNNNSSNNTTNNKWWGGTLKVLCLDRNPLEYLPEDWHELQQLEQLYLRHTNLTRLPRRLPSQSLKILHLSSNPSLINVDALLLNNNSNNGAGQRGMEELTQLYLNGCGLTSLPAGIVSRHPKLERLVISHNPSLHHAPIDMWHAIRGKELVAKSAEIVWEPNPQLKEGTTELVTEAEALAEEDLLSPSSDEDEDEDAAGAAMEGVELSKE